jgi:hypothetical protein
MNVSAIATILVTLSLLKPSAVFAVTIPQFPSCANPTGTVIANHATGTHGIVGDTKTYTGSDTVYRIGDTQVTQCFCAENGSGIQTDWLDVNNLGNSDIDILVAQGWIYVPDGSLWGLSQGPYVANNIAYQCLPGNNGGTGGGSSSNNQTGGTTLSTSTGSVLGLAATGDMWKLYATFVAAVTLLISGLRKLKNSL